MLKVKIECTDTYGGDANYSWVKWKTVKLPDGSHDRDIVLKAKASLGLTGVRCDREDWGDRS